MAINNWKIWKPELTGTLTLLNVLDDTEKLELTMQSNIDNKNTKIKFTYNGIIGSYRQLPTKYRVSTIQEFEQSYKKVNCLFISNQSEYLNWFNKEMLDIPFFGHLTHQLYMTTNYVIDILNGYEPEVTVMPAFNI